MHGDPDPSAELLALRLRVEERDRSERRQALLEKQKRRQEEDLQAVTERLAVLDSDLGALRSHDVLSVLARLTRKSGPMIEKREEERARLIIEEQALQQAAAATNAALDDIGIRLRQSANARSDHAKALARAQLASTAPPDAAWSEVAAAVSATREITEAIDAAGACLAQARDMKSSLERVGASPAVNFLALGFYAWAVASIELDETARQAGRLRGRLIRLTNELDDLEEPDSILAGHIAELHRVQHQVPDLVAKRHVSAALKGLEDLLGLLVTLMTTLAEARSRSEDAVRSGLLEAGKTLETPPS